MLPMPDIPVDGFFDDMPAISEGKQGRRVHFESEIFDLIQKLGRVADDIGLIGGLLE